MTGELLKTACYQWHVEQGGRMVDFAGWSMPVQYTSIVEEHEAVRKNVGLFDIAHMGRLKFTGPDACSFLDKIVTNDVTAIKTGQIRYALVTNEKGGILDDVLVYHMEDHYMLVVNASNRLKILDWISKQKTSFDVKVDDQTFSHSMLALQGPASDKLLSSLVSNDLGEIKYYHFIESEILGHPVLISRTGYTGEDGFEIIIENEFGLELWKSLMEKGSSFGIRPAGLGCRDTLRLEAAMPLYGHELDETRDPLSAGLSFGVRLKAGDFIGKDALLRLKEESGIRQDRVGLELEGKRIAREGALIFSGDKQVGEITSGTFSPTMQKTIAMGYIDTECSSTGENVEIDIRGKRIPARIVSLPFYSRKEK